jgi:hypothetical protein
MTQVARIGDTCQGLCYAHKTPLSVTATIQDGSSDSLADSIGIARVGDTVLTTCGHTGTIATGSSTFLVNGIQVARVGDTTTGQFIGTIISGSEDVLTT